MARIIACVVGVGFAGQAGGRSTDAARGPALSGPILLRVDYLIAPERHATPQFVLRSYDAGDGPLLREANVESFEHLRPWMPWATPTQSAEDAERIVRQFRGRYLLAEDFVLGVFSPDEKRLLGGTGFHLREGPLSTACAEIGMFIRKAEANRGLGTRVLGAMLAWGFTDWPWLRLAWRCDQRNLPSMRVAEKAGLRLEGVLRGQHEHAGPGRRDTVCYATTKANWIATARR
jgi:RimJ/RimL family protein N-acetyltransferase